MQSRTWQRFDCEAPELASTLRNRSNALTEMPDGYMANNLEVDDRGYILAVERNGAGFDIIVLRGKAKKIGLGIDDKRGHGHDRDDDD